MSQPKIDPARFNLDPCGCAHCGCGCPTCTGAAEWIRIGDGLLSDRSIMLPSSALTPTPKPIRSIALPGYLVGALAAEYGDQPSDEWFQPRYLEPLEEAGYRVRPVAEARSAQTLPSRVHGILHQGAVVGLLMPLDNGIGPARKAS